MIGVLTPNIGGFYYASLLAGVQAAARKYGARVVAFQTKGMEAVWPDEPETLPLGWDRIDGWIAINDFEAGEFCRRIHRAGKPLVYVSARPEGFDCCSVLPDNYNGALAATRHLLDHGHKRIAFAGFLGQMDIRERYHGYVAALQERGIAPDPGLLFEAAFTMEPDGLDVGRLMLAQGVDFTAVMASTDLNAFGIMHALRDGGYRFPQDIAITGFDDIELAQYTEPPLTTVRQSFRGLSARATEALLRHLVLGAPLDGVLRVPTALVPRYSCGCQSTPDVRLPESIRAASGQSREQALSRALLALLGEELHTDAPIESGQWPGVRELASHACAIIDGGPRLSPTELRGTWQSLMALTQNVATVEGLLGLTEQTILSWCARDTSDRSSSEKTREAIRQLRLELMRAWLTEEQSRRRYYDSVSFANRRINVALIGADFTTTKDLSWLRDTRVPYACLGLWSAPGSDAPRQLEIISIFGAEEEQDAFLRSAHSPAAFPPEPICELLDRHSADNILNVIPITGAGPNVGLFAVVGPIEVEMFDHLGSIGQWGALLSASMDREKLMASLREGYERESRFTQTLRESEERYALAARGANDGLWDWNTMTGHVHYSPRWKAILGYEDDEIESSFDAWLSRVHADDLAMLEQTVTDHLTGVQDHIEYEYRMIHKDGTYRWVLCRGVAVFEPDGVPVRVAGSQTDITARKKAEEQLRNNALHDVLTGLPNRALLVDRLEWAIAHARRNSDYNFAVMFLDLDRFKTINDSLGHLAGDQLLVQISQRLRDCLRTTDTIARFGGDEFAIILSDLNEASGAEVVAQRIQEALRVPFDIDGHVVVTSTSIGITVSSEKYEHAEDFLRDADNAMYRAKVQGRARHEVFDAPMHDQAMERLRLEADLRHAIDHGGFLLHYQPILSLSTGDVVGLEALIRWKHPQQGFLSPAAFLPVAEETGLIVPISEWVLRTACAQMREWHLEGLDSLSVSINVPSRQLDDPRLIDLLATTLHEAGLPPRALGLELVESSLIENKASVVELLQRVQRLGIHISLDDFGTGYSSLSYLKRFPINTLKIDRSFTQGVPTDPNDSAISTAIIAMAHSLALNVVAEGVETQEQLDFFRGRGCDMLQGYFLSRPLPAEECRRYLLKKQNRGARLAHAV